MKNLILALVLFTVVKVEAQTSFPVFLTFQAPNGSYPTVNNANFDIFVITPISNCILIHEEFLNQQVVNGVLSINIGEGIRGSGDMGFTIEESFSNSTPRNNLNCLDNDLNVVATNQTYNPNILDTRVIRVSGNLQGDDIVVDFKIRSSPFALNAFNSESLGGKVASEFISQNSSSALNQTNLENLLSDTTKFNNLLNVATNGSASAVTSVAGKIGVVNLVASDISGLGTAATLNVGTAAGTLAAGDDSRIVNSLQTSDYLLDVASASCTSSQTASWNTTTNAWECLSISFPASAVTSVAGKTGVVNLVASDISGLGTAATLNVGTTAGTIAAGDDSRIIGSLQTSDYLLDVASASCTSSQTASWNTTTIAWECLSISFPASAVTSVAGKTGVVNLVASDISGLGTAATLNVGTAAGTLAAGDDARIIGSLQTSDYLLDVASASCTSSQTASWNTTTNAWECLSISFPASAVTSVAGKTGVVNLVASDISGLGAAATLNVGTTAGTVASGNDSRIIGSLQSSDYLLDVSTANCAINEIPTWNTILDAWQCSSISFPASAVTSVAGKTGVVNLVASDISGLGSVATLNVGTAAGTVAAGDDSRIIGSLQTSDYLLDVASASCTSSQTASWNTTTNAWECLSISFPASAVTSVAGKTGVVNLVASDISGLGTAATRNVGTAAGTVASGNDSRIIGSLQTSDYLFDVSAANCPLNQIPTWSIILDAWQCSSISFPASSVTSVAGKTGVVNLVASDISGLGTAATLNVGATAGNLVQLDGTSRVPASLIPNNYLTTSSVFAGDVSGSSSSTSVNRLQGTNVSSAAPATGTVLYYNGTQWTPTNLSTLVASITPVPVFTKKTANQSLTTTTLTAVTDFSNSLTAGRLYKFKYFLIFSSANTANGIGFGLTFPAASLMSSEVSIPAGGDGTAAMFQGVINASSDSVLSTTTPVANTQHFATIEGTILPTTSGNLVLTARSETTTSITIFQNSFLEITEIP